jgi:radical SAM protein with 4Fe4S-binding SPASM domain
MKLAPSNFLGYKEIRTEHYNKWEKSQSERYFEYRRKWKENGEKLIVEDYPLHLDIAITNVCNLECTFCARTVRVEDGTWRKAQHMDLDLFKKIIDEATEMGTYSLNMNLLNEPLTHPKLLEMIKYAKEKGIVDVFFHSHGGLLNKKKAEELLESGLDRLLISIDSPYKEKYNKIRVLSDFDNVMENLRNFKKMRDERGQLNPVIRVSCIQFPDMPVEEIEDAKKLFLQFSDAIGFQQYVDPRKEVGKDKKYSDGYQSQFVCQQPFTRVSIIEDGRVSPCCLDYDQDLVIGDLNKQSLKEIWESNKLKGMRKILKKGEFYKIPACATCQRATDADAGIVSEIENLEPTA